MGSKLKTEPKKVMKHVQNCLVGIKAQLFVIKILFLVVGITAHLIYKYSYV